MEPGKYDYELNVNAATHRYLSFKVFSCKKVTRRGTCSSWIKRTGRTRIRAERLPATVSGSFSVSQTRGLPKSWVRFNLVKGAGRKGIGANYTLKITPG